MLSQYERIIEHYKNWYPNLYERTVSCKPVGRYSILLNLNNGDRIEYDDLDHTIRDVTRYYVRESSETYDEESWRKEFGRKLRSMIADKGITQERVSDLTGLSRQMLTRYVKGMSTPSGYMLTRLSEALDCDIRDLTKFGYIDE